VWLLNAHISPYQPLNTRESYDPNRSRKLLLNRVEIRQLIGKTSQKGLTLVPLKVYTKKSLIKVEIGLARHRKKHDKREVLKKRDAKREISKAQIA
jgi:SsrA-binding protein